MVVAALGDTMLADPTFIIASFAGGAFGAALGALPAFIFTGFLVIAGEAANAIGLTAVDQNPDAAGVQATEFAQQATAETALGASGMTGIAGFGPIFGPHISFAAGAAAAAYAAKKGYIDDGKNILWAAGTNHMDVLFVGGIFGLIGLTGTSIGRAVGVPTDNIALMVFVSALIHRVAFGYSVIGEITGDGIFDLGPWERDEDEAPGIWLPWQYKWPNVAFLGVIAGALGAFGVTALNSWLIGFGISAASLVFLQCGVDNIPVTHHITLPGAVGAAGAMPLYGAEVAMLAGIGFGVFGALAGEFCNRVFYMHGETHVDPPAFGIAASGFLSAILIFLDVFSEATLVAWPQI